VASPWNDHWSLVRQSYVTHVLEDVFRSGRMKLMVVDLYDESVTKVCDLSSSQAHAREGGWRYKSGVPRDYTRPKLDQALLFRGIATRRRRSRNILPLRLAYLLSVESLNVRKRVSLSRAYCTTCLSGTSLTWARLSLSILSSLHRLARP